MPLKKLHLFLLSFLLLAAPALAQPPGAKPDAKEAKPDAKEAKPPEEKASVTRHSLTLNGQKLPYTATAGNLLLKDEEGTVKASVFYVAYTLDGVKDPGARPVTFAFNGGPGSASLWLHMGAFGPKKVERTAEGMATPPPGRLVDNEESILDVTDVVFIDPVSTGFSRAAPGQDAKQFHGVKKDVDSVADFIRLWTTRNQRWASPKFVAGESYGTTRAAGLAYQLAERHGMYLNGVILISSVLNWQDQDFHVGNDQPCFIHLPTYAATAWYHKKLAPELSGDLMKTLAEVEAFACDEYAPALLQGDRLPDARRREIAAKVARYSGLSPAYVERANLCVEIFRFCKELLREEGKTVGRIDTRFTGTDLDAAGENFEYDPSIASLTGAYGAAINDYLRRELKYESDLVYERSGNVWPWDWEDFANQYVNMGELLRRAMTRNPDLRVLMTSGVYDLATPYFDTLFTKDHLGLPKELRDHVQVELYEAGHMMYIRKADHQKLKRDLAAFIRKAAP
ncbi:MAG TPA: peptidase S10 [Thermoanaerobaculia bacterium]|jgi:carboxypeptidase C (cathepsin A)|nr:peptidase S10 [Thermoanaerobaculia bacterium]